MKKQVPNVPELRDNSTIWREKMRNMLGSDEAVSDYMRKIGSKGGSKSRGGGYAGNPEKARAAGKKSGQVRRAKKAS